MKNGGLLKFLAGAAMTVGGLFALSRRIVVSSGFFGSFGLGGFSTGNGILMIPLIAGIIWIFATGGRKKAPWILAVLGFFFILAEMILSARIHLVTMSLYEWIIILVLIFGGIGLLINSLFGRGDEEDRGMHRDKPDRHPPVQESRRDKIEQQPSQNAPKISTDDKDIEKELERMKRGL